MKISIRRAGLSGRRIGAISGLMAGVCLLSAGCSDETSTAAGAEAEPAAAEAEIGSSRVTTTTAAAPSTGGDAGSVTPSTVITVPPSSSVTTMTVETAPTTVTTIETTTEPPTTEPPSGVAGDVAEIRRLLDSGGAAATVGVLISVQPDAPQARLDQIEAALSGTGSTVLSRGSVVPVISAALTMAGLDSLLASEATAAIDLDRAMTS